MNKFKHSILFLIVLAILNVASFADGKSAVQIVKEMKAGWNLGNTLDACDEKSGKQMGLETETYWKQPKTTKEIINTIAKAGFTTIRIPVSWHNHYAKGKINEAWMARVKEVVDMALEAKLYVVINIHHDTYNGSGSFWGYYPSKKFEKQSVEYVKTIWTQITAAFADYDERLIFETLNEPRLRGDDQEWNYNATKQKCKDAMEIINKLNQIAVDTIRAAGGKNKDRLIIVTPYVASYDAILYTDDFKIPNDPSKKLAVSVHMYQPYNFAMASPGEKIFTENHALSLTDSFEWLDEKFVQEGVPIFIGEFGAVNKNNAAERIKWVQHFIKASYKFGMATCLWDNGDYKLTSSDYTEKFGYFDRKNLSWYDEAFIKALVNSYK